MSEWTAARTRHAMQLLDVCRKHSAVRVPDISEHIVHAWYKCYVFVRPEGLAAGWSRDRVLSEIAAQGVPCYSGSCLEVYLEKAFDGSGFRPAERLPVARAFGETSLMFLVHPTLTVDQMGHACSVLDAVLGLASR